MIPYSHSRHRKLFIAAFAGTIGVVLIALVYNNMFSAPQKDAETERFLVMLDTKTSGAIDKLLAGGFIKNAWAFRFALSWQGIGSINPGGYEVSKSMNAWDVADVFRRGPILKWVVIPEGLRKEEIAEILARVLGWGEEIKKQWITVDTATHPHYVEGVYFPDTYLIPVSEPSEKVAEQLRAVFEEKFAPYAREAARQDIKWTTVLTIASLIQREAAGKKDMPIIAGILWNRLRDDMKLDIDATLQYARDTVAFQQAAIPIHWWAPISPEDKQVDSPYNTYMHKGLPPHPIANPGLDAIQAVLQPVKTECFYYLHDAGGIIRCANTYQEHLKNIEIYLR